MGKKIRTTSGRVLSPEEAEAEKHTDTPLGRDLKKADQAYEARRKGKR